MTDYELSINLKRLYLRTYISGFYSLKKAVSIKVSHVTGYVPDVTSVDFEESMKCDISCISSLSILRERK